jgi:outer membrane protein OmpA-like peptidoglycan-associated protein
MRKKMKKTTKLTLAGVVMSLALAGCAGVNKNEPPPPAPPPEPPPPAVVPETISIQTDGLFDFDSAKIKPDLAARLDEVAEKVYGKTYSSVEVVGHTCSIGSEAYNQGLSERRAESAAEYLANAGVDRNKISFRGEGETNPAYSNATRESRAKNRRIEVIIQ